MRRRIIVPLLLLLAAPAGASSWGPTAGGLFIQPSREGAKPLIGWEAGLALFGPQGEGFWHFTYAQAKRGADDAKLTALAARLNFRLLSRKGLMLYAGPGIHRESLEAPGAGRLWRWVERLQAGLLVAPARMHDDLQRAPSMTPPPTGPEAPKTLGLGIEGGYRWGAVGFRGWDARAFLLYSL